ncbi:MAG: hypothetical protein K6V97_06290 [Actinomycetia bacterium]|nr:hypothetical protein [Actinomycetes bacterium]
MSPLERQDLWFLFFGYTALFVIMFGFLYRMLERSRRIQQEVDLLREEYHIQEDAKEADPSSVGRTGIKA